MVPLSNGERPEGDKYKQFLFATRYPIMSFTNVFRVDGDIRRGQGFHPLSVCTSSGKELT